MIKEYFIKKYPQWKDRWIPKILFFAGKILLFLTLCYLAAGIIFVACNFAADKISKATEKSLESLHIPNLLPEVQSVGLYHSSDNAKVIVWKLKIFNTGAPTITKEWNMRIKGYDKASTPGILSTVSTATNYFKGGIGIEEILEWKNSIVNKTSHIPISGMEEGHVSFVFLNINGEYINAPGTTCELSFKDNYGRLYTLETNVPPPTRQ